jgi:DNA-binding MarR family transcriptional regulator
MRNSFLRAALAGRIFRGVKKLPASIERPIRRMFTRIITALAHDLRDDDLSVAQVAALHLVDDVGAMRLSALADAIGSSPSATSRMIDDLVQRHLLSRAEDPDDRRAKLVRLTREGEGFIRKASEGRLRVISENLPTLLPGPLLDSVLAVFGKHRD